MTVEKGFKFNKHAKILSATISTKVEKLAKVMPYLNFKYRKRVVEAIVLSSLMYCLPVWGWNKTVRKTTQKAMNKGIRLITQQPEMSSITEQLEIVNWPNMDNLWRLESIMVRDDGLRIDWWPKNCHGYNAFMYTSSELYNELRVSQSSWFDTVKNRDMTRKEVSQCLLSQLIQKHGNTNLK